MKRNPKMFRCRLTRMVDGAMQVITYVGPYESIPKGWSMFMRRVVGPSGGMAA